MTDEEVAAAALSDLAPRETRRWSFVGSELPVLPVEGGPTMMW